MNGCSFRQLLRHNFKLVSTSTQENLFSQRFHFKANRKIIGSSKKWYQALLLFYMKITENFECFQYFNFETFVKKLEYRFVVEITMIESITDLYKTALLEANVKINRMETTKWTYHKEYNFASSFFVFLKILFQYVNLL